MKHILTTLLVAILLVYSGESKPKPAHYNNWIFGDNAGITFTTSDGNPKALELIDKYSLYEGTSSISDDDGDLLYYLFLESTNGVKGIQKIKSPQGTISNGDSILSGYSPSNSGLFIQDFTNTDLYYFISVADATPENTGINYSIIDRSKDGGNGEVILKNKNLYKNATEKMTAVMNEVDNICWVITHGWGNDYFKIIRIDQNGLDENIITQKIGLVHSSVDRVSGVGRSSMSPDGKTLAITVSSESYGKVELFDFDSKKGLLSNPRTLNIESFAYSLCFSPNGKVLYVKGINRIYQYDLSISDIDEMVNKRYTINTKKSSIYETIERGPNGVIYCGRRDKTYLDAIVNPDIIGAGCNYTEDVVDIGGIFFWGLPTVINSYSPREYEIEAPEYACFGDEFEISIKSDYDVPFEARLDLIYPDPAVIASVQSTDSTVLFTTTIEARQFNWNNSYKVYITTSSGEYDTLSFKVNGWVCCGNTVRNGRFNAKAGNNTCYPVKYNTDLDFRSSQSSSCPSTFTSVGQIASNSTSGWYNPNFNRDSKEMAFFLFGDPNPNRPQRAWYQSNPTRVGSKYKLTAYVTNIEETPRQGGENGKSLHFWLGIKSKDSFTRLKQIDYMEYKDGWVELSDEFMADYNTTELSIWVLGACPSKLDDCVSYGFGIDEISLVPIDDYNLDIQNDTTICIDDSFQSNNIFTGEIESVVWSPTTGLSNPNILNPIVSPDVNTVYTITVEDKYGCEFVDSVAISVDDCRDKCIPCVTYSFEDMEINLGEGYCINASFYPTCIDSTILNGLSLYFEYDPYLMKFVTASASSQIISNGDMNILRLDYDASAIKLDVFNNINICFTALLGSTDIAKLTQYEDEKTKEELCVIGADSATITYLACNFPIRKIRLTSLTSFDPVYTDNKVTVSLSTEEKGLFRFVMLDPAGRIIKQESFTTTKDKYDNEKVVYFDASDISSGAYFVRMQTPAGKIATLKLLIVK
jgi:hypothetical protein